MYTVSMRENKGPINLKSLKEQVYDYLREQFQQRRLQPGDMIHMEATSQKLGISKTPLRDALIQLEMEGFVTINPRRGIFVNALTIDDIREFYQVIGALESSALQAAFPRLDTARLKKINHLNREMRQAIEKDNFNLFYEKNLCFHDSYIDLCGNNTLIRIIGNLKKRLYDFPRQKEWVKEWEESSILEHQKLVDLLTTGDIQAAVIFLRDVHWSFQVQEKFIRKYYAPVIGPKG
jgi:DNA-binding GntR family transcriptional regulator